MCQTLLLIPERILGIPTFGFGWLLAVWAVAAGLTLGGLAWRHGWSAETRSYLPVLAISGAVIAFLLPRLIEQGGLPIRGYGVMLLIAVSSAVALAVYRARRVGLDPELILSLGFWLFVAGIIGARMFYVVEYWDKFQRPTLGETLAGMINVTQGGLVVYGSLLAGAVALFVFVRKHKLPALAICDLVAPSVALGMALGRVGCFLNGCCYGGLSELPWAVSFPWHTPPHLHQVEHGDVALHGIFFAAEPDAPAVVAGVERDSLAARAGLRVGERITSVNGQHVRTVAGAQSALLAIGAPGNAVELEVAGKNGAIGWTVEGALPGSRPVHPAQLYSFFDALLLCLFLLAYDPYRRRDGELTAWMLTLHPISRFLIEIIRIDESAVFGTHWSISQNISLALLVVAAGLWVYLWRQEPRIAFAGAAAIA